MSIKNFVLFIIISIPGCLVIVYLMSLLEKIIQQPEQIVQQWNGIIQRAKSMLVSVLSLLVIGEQHIIRKLRTIFSISFPTPSGQLALAKIDYTECFKHHYFIGPLNKRSDEEREAWAKKVLKR